MKQPTEPELLPTEMPHLRPVETKLARLGGESHEVARPEPSVGEMMQTMLTNGITQQNVAAFTELVKLKEHMEDRKEARDSLRAFNMAFTKLQRAIPNIRADRVVPDGKGGTLYRYSSYEEIMAQVQPLLTEHGFSVRFSQSMETDRVTMTCHLMHEGGHSVTNDYTVRSGRGAPGMNETKCDSSASTVGQREALCDALNIIRRNRDEDPRMQGGKVTQEQADELEHRAQLTNSDIPAFLKLAGAEKFSEIAAVKFDMLSELLARKERKGK